MILDQQTFQHLADIIMSDIGYNINIIEPTGKIIASGSPERVGTSHSVAMQAALVEKRIDIGADQTGNYQGVLPGVNQPFYYRQQLVGIIGITGLPAEVDEFVKISKTMIELMVEQEMLKKKLFLRRSSKAQLANLLLNIRGEKEATEVKQRARSLGYSFEAMRQVVIIEMATDDLLFSEEDVLAIVKRTDLHRKADFSTYYHKNEWLVFKTVEKTDKIVEYAEAVYQALSRQTKQSVYLGIGSAYPALADAAVSYEEAVFVIHCLKKEGKKSGVGRIEDYVFDYLVNSIDRRTREHFLMPYQQKLATHDNLLLTIRSLCQSNMNLIETAKVLYVHRNTVIFRLRRIKEVTGLDPLHNYRDRLICYLLSV